MKAIWHATLSELEGQVSSHNFESWFKQIEFGSIEGDRAHLSVADEFLKAWIEANYVALIEEAMSAVCGRPMRASIAVADAVPKPARNVEWSEPIAARAARAPAPARPAADPRRAAHDAGLNARYTFEEFVVGPSNQFAHAACDSVAADPGKNYNPLFIFGGVGLGKTHLLHSVGNEIAQRRPGARICVLSSEEFMNGLITSLRQREMGQFRAQFRDEVDVLLIDDIQFIGGKDSTQEEFFHTFNALYHAGKQIVVTSDQPPKELPGIEERLRSRFSWGLIADIQPPQMETRLAILEKKAEADKIALSKEVAMLIASSIRSNVRDLEGTLVRIGAQASLLGRPITIEMAREHLHRLNLDGARQISVERIIEHVARRFGITPSDILGARRTRSISEPRQYAMYLARKLTSHSYPELARRFGGKDHTTVLAAFRKMERLVREEDETAVLLRDLEAALI